MSSEIGSKYMITTWPNYIRNPAIHIMAHIYDMYYVRNINCKMEAIGSYLSCVIVVIVDRYIINLVIIIPTYTLTHRILYELR